MKALASLLVLTLWLGGCAAKGPTVAHNLVVPENFVWLTGQSTLVADALCVKATPVPGTPGSKPFPGTATDPAVSASQAQAESCHTGACCEHPQACCAAGLVVTFQITQTLTGRTSRDSWTVKVEPALASQPGVDGQPFFVEGRTYRLFFSGDRGDILQIGCVEQFDRFITQQLGQGGAFEVHVLPLGRR